MILYYVIIFIILTIISLHVFNRFVQKILYQPPFTSIPLPSYKLFIKDKSYFTLVIFHGNATNIEGMKWFYSSFFSKLEYNVVLMTYPSYCGESNQKINQSMVVNHCFDSISFLVKTGTINQQKLGFYGISLGAAVATQLARIFQPSCLILENPFTSVSDMCCHFGRLPKFFSSLIELTLYDPWPTKDTILNILCPVMFISSLNDQLIPPWMTKSLASLCNSRVQLVEIKYANHNSTWLHGEEIILESMKQFIADL